MPLSRFEQMTVRDTAIPLGFAGEDLMVSGSMAKGIFTDSWEEAVLETGEEVTSHRLYADVAESAFDTLPERGDSVIRDGHRFTVREVRVEGLGMVRLLLNDALVALPIKPLGETFQRLMLSQAFTLPGPNVVVGMLDREQALHLLIEDMIYPATVSGDAVTIATPVKQLLGTGEVFTGGMTRIGETVYVSIGEGDNTVAAKLYAVDLDALVSSDALTKRQVGTLPIAGHTSLARLGEAQQFFLTPRSAGSVYEMRNILVPPEAQSFTLASEDGDVSMVTFYTSVTMSGHTLLFEWMSTGTSRRMYLLRSGGDLSFAGTVTIGSGENIYAAAPIGDQIYLALADENRALSLARMKVDFV